MNSYFLKGVLAFSLWGVLPLYISLLSSFNSITVTNFRIISSMVILSLLFKLNPFTLKTYSVFKNKKELGLNILSTLLIGINWYVFVYAVEIRELKEASLGYYLAPLFSVLLGKLLLGEKLSGIRLIAISLGLIGTVLQIISIGKIPLIALSLALSFSLYGFVRKKSQLTSLRGLYLETVLLSPLAFILTIIYGIDNLSQVDHSSLSWSLLILSGLISSAPLFLFKEAASKLELTTIGILQYIAPSLQLLIAYFIFNESFSSERLIGVGFVILASILIILNNILQKR